MPHNAKKILQSFVLGSLVGLSSHQAWSIEASKHREAAKSVRSCSGKWEAADDALSITVASGETAAVLANRYGVPLDALLRANNYNSTPQLQAGSRIVIPVYQTGRGRVCAGSSKKIVTVTVRPGHGPFHSAQPLVDHKAETSIESLRKAAEQGNVSAQIALGLIFADGRGVARNEAAAMTWFRTAAEQGDAVGQNNLGAMLTIGPRALKNEAEAVVWFRKAAEQGNNDAKVNLALMLVTGRGVARDEAEAVTWFRRAAEHKNVDAQLYLALMLADGRGVRKDEDEAFFWFRKVAGRRSAIWQRTGPKNVDSTEKTASVPAEQKLADGLNNLRTSAKHGDVDAQFELGFILANRPNLAEDAAEAMTWFRQAADQKGGRIISSNNPDASLDLLRLMIRISEENGSGK